MARTKASLRRSQPQGCPVSTELRSMLAKVCEEVGLPGGSKPADIITCLTDDWGVDLSHCKDFDGKVRAMYCAVSGEQPKSTAKAVFFRGKDLASRMYTLRKRATFPGGGAVPPLQRFKLAGSAVCQFVLLHRIVAEYIEQERRRPLLPESRAHKRRRTDDEHELPQQDATNKELDALQSPSSGGALCSSLRAEHELPPDCELQFHREALADAPPGSFDALWERFPDPPPNPLNPAQRLRRSQMTYGGAYRFGRQLSPDAGPVEQAPELVQMALRDARQRAAGAGLDPALYNSVHCNAYPDGRAGLSWHGDDERDHLRGAPIYSYSFVQCPPGGVDYRLFQVRRRSDGALCRSLQTRNGDLVVMAGGAFQTSTEHRVPSTSARGAAATRRINLTVRARDVAA
jgi:alkylated DNA repair dioxygenase AlkB